MSEGPFNKEKPSNIKAPMEKLSRPWHHIVTPNSFLTWCIGCQNVAKQWLRTKHIVHLQMI